MAIQDTVREKLRSQIVKDLIQKKDTQTLRAVYAKLLEMDPGNTEVLAAIDDLEKTEASLEKKKRTDYFKNADQTILNFLKEENLVNAEQAALEMLSYYPENKHYKSLLEKIEARQTKLYNKGLTEFFKKISPLLSQEYKANKEAFIVL